MKSIVYNLATGEELIFTLAPEEALISAAIIAAGETGNLINPITRAKFAKRIVRTHRGNASIDYLAVKL